MSIWIVYGQSGSAGTMGLAHHSDSLHIVMVLVLMSQLMTGISNSREGSDRIIIVAVRAIATMTFLWSIDGSRLAGSTQSWSIDQNILRMSAMDTIPAIPRTVRMSSFTQSVRPMTSLWVRRGDPMTHITGASYNRISRKSGSISSRFRVTIDTISRFTTSQSCYIFTRRDSLPVSLVIG